MHEYSTEIVNLNDFKDIKSFIFLNMLNQKQKYKKVMRLIKKKINCFAFICI